MGPFLAYKKGYEAHPSIHIIYVWEGRRLLSKFEPRMAVVLEGHLSKRSQIVVYLFFIRRRYGAF
jgi:hypothetical protein